MSIQAGGEFTVVGTLIRSLPTERPTESLTKKQIVLLVNERRNSQVVVDLINEDIPRMLPFLKKDAQLKVTGWVNGRSSINRNSGDEMWWLSLTGKNIEAVEIADAGSPSEAMDALADNDVEF